MAQASKRQRAFASLAFRVADDISVRLGEEGYLSSADLDDLDHCLDAVVCGKRCWPKIARTVWQVLNDADLNHPMFRSEDKTALQKVRARVIRLARKLDHPVLADVR